MNESLEEIPALQEGGRQTVPHLEGDEDTWEAQKSKRKKGHIYEEGHWFVAPTACQPPRLNGDAKAEVSEAAVPLMAARSCWLQRIKRLYLNVCDDFQKIKRYKPFQNRMLRGLFA